MKEHTTPATEQGLKTQTKHCLHPRRSVVYRALSETKPSDWDPSLLYGFKDIAAQLDISWKTLLFRLNKDKWPKAKIANLHQRSKPFATLVWGETLQELTEYSRAAFAHIRGGKA